MSIKNGIVELPVVIGFRTTELERARLVAAAKVAGKKPGELLREYLAHILNRRAAVDVAQKAAQSGKAA